MGAGCWYTNKYYDKDDQEQYIKAVWLEIDSECEFDYQNSLDGLKSHLKSILQVTYQDDKEIQTKLYNISFLSDGTC
jgi:hypothetical protein